MISPELRRAVTRISPQQGPNPHPEIIISLLGLSPEEATGQPRQPFDPEIPPSLPDEIRAALQAAVRQELSCLADEYSCQYRGEIDIITVFRGDDVVQLDAVFLNASQGLPWRVARVWPRERQ